MTLDDIRTILEVAQKEGQGITFLELLNMLPDESLKDQEIQRLKDEMIDYTIWRQRALDAENRVTVLEQSVQGLLNRERRERNREFAESNPFSVPKWTDAPIYEQRTPTFHPTRNGPVF